MLAPTVTTEIRVAVLASVRIRLVDFHDSSADLTDSCLAPDPDERDHFRTHCHIYGFKRVIVSAGKILET